MSIDKLSTIWPEWSVVEQIGEGSFGKVFKIKREERGFTDYAAVKVISIPKSDDELRALRAEGYDETRSRSHFEDIVTGFENEVKLMASMKGMTNIVSVEDYKIVERPETIGWDIFIRMELLTPFNDFISDKKLTESEVIKLGQDICTALELCSKKNIIHRDIKPENILVSAFGDFKVGDFGVARELENNASMTLAGAYNYIAPEIATSKKYDATVDIYSLGLVLYKLLNNNRLPFLDPKAQLISHQDRQSAVSRRLSGEALPLPIEASPQMAQVILKACTYNPRDRYQSASDFKQALTAAKAEKHREASIPSSKKRRKMSVYSSKTKRVVALISGFTAVIVIGAVVFIILYLGNYGDGSNGQTGTQNGEQQVDIAETPSVSARDNHVALEKITYNIDGSRIEREFDSEGRVITGEYYDIDGKLIIRGHIEYDDRGYEINRKCYYWDDNGDYTLDDNGERELALWMELERDADGNLLKETVYRKYSGNDDIYIYRRIDYNISADGKRIKESEYWGNGTLLREALYDDNGNKIEEVIYNADRTIQWKWRFTYDIEGNLLSTTRHSTLSGKISDAGDINPVYRDAVDIVTSLDIRNSFWKEGRFFPDLPLTRMDLVYIISYLDMNPFQIIELMETRPSEPVFTDVNAYMDDIRYTNYCVSKGFMTGYSDGSFRPNDTVTTMEFITSMLRLLGYGENGELTDSTWAAKSDDISSQLRRTASSLTDGLDFVDWQGDITREEAAQIIVNTILYQSTVKYIDGEYVETGITVVESKLSCNTDLTPNLQSGARDYVEMLRAISYIT